MDVEYSRLGLVDAAQAVFHDRYPAVISGHWINGYVKQIAFGHQILQRLRGLLLIEGVLIQLRPDGEQIIAQDALPGSQDGFLINGDGNRNQDPDNRDNYQNLDQRESAARPTSLNTVCHREPYQSCWCRRQTRSARPRRWTWDRPACCASPSPACWSSDREESCASISLSY